MMPTVRITPEEEARLVAQGATVRHSNPDAFALPPVEIAPPEVGCSEKEFQARVVKLANELGWERVYHTHDSRKSEPGFPDTAFGRTWGQTRLIVAELKVVPNKASEAQLWWLRVFEGAGVPAFLWYPDQFSEIVAVLKRA